MKIALVIRHVAFEDLGLLQPMIENAGYQVRYLEAGMDELTWIDPLDPALLIVLGGPISVNDEANYPFIDDELNILKTRMHQDLPTLGICLGAQLMAKALGASISPMALPRIGWAPIKITEAGKRSVLNKLMTKNTNVLHWHGETFDLPEGAECLASTDDVPNQAFQWKKRCLALQFHPEVTVQGIERWLIGHSVEIESTDGVSIAELRKQTEQHGYLLQEDSDRFFRAWLEEVGK